VNAEAERLSQIVINCGLQLHRDVGPGMLEAVYEQVLARRLEALDLKIDRQLPVKAVIDGVPYPDAFRCDVLVNDLLLLEIKSIAKLGPIHVSQTLTYLRFMNLPLGLVLNFGGDTFKEGIRRVTNTHAK
jgi:GxxExxY protein